MWPFISKCLNPLYPRILCVRFGWNWPSGSWVKGLLTVINVFSLCGKYLPLEKWKTLKLNKFEFPLPKNPLCPVWLKLAHWFWRRFSKVVNIFSICCYYLTLEKGQGPSFERNWIPLTQGCSVPSLVEIGPVVLENKSSMYFHCVAIISLWQRAWPNMGTNLNRLHLECCMSSTLELDSVIPKKLICEKIWMDIDFNYVFHYVAIIISLW